MLNILHLKAPPPNTKQENLTHPVWQYTSIPSKLKMFVFKNLFSGLFTLSETTRIL